MNSEIAKALIALIFTGVIGGILKVYLDYKAKQMELIWDKRLEAYIEFVKKTALFPLYPPREVKYKDVFNLSLEFRDWYFAGNGIVLSKSFRDEYFKLQEYLLTITKNKIVSEDNIGVEYTVLQKKCSALRTLIVEELDSRENPFSYRFTSKRKA